MNVVFKSDTDLLLMAILPGVGSVKVCVSIGINGRRHLSPTGYIFCTLIARVKCHCVWKIWCFQCDSDKSKGAAYLLWQSLSVRRIHDANMVSDDQKQKWWFGWQAFWWMVLAAFRNEFIPSVAPLSHHQSLKYEYFKQSQWLSFRGVFFLEFWRWNISASELASSWFHYYLLVGEACQIQIKQKTS